MKIERKILLNPGPATTTDSVKMAQVVPDICPREKEFAGMMKQLRDDLVRVAHGNLEKHTAVLFCGSGTINIDICLNSLLPEDKRVLIVNNGAYSTRAVEVCQYYGLPHINLEFSVYERPDLSVYKRQNKMFHFHKTFCSKFSFINTKQNVHFIPFEYALNEIKASNTANS